MKLSALDKLSCPRPGARARCDGNLSVHRVISPKNPGDEVSEGFLSCDSCASRFPVVAGIPILHHEPAAFLRRRLRLFLGFCRSEKVITRAMEKALGEFVMENFDPRGRRDPESEGSYDRGAKEDLIRDLGSYILEHHDAAPATAPFRGPLRGLAGFSGPLLHKELARMLDRHSPTSGREVAVDFGCSVGGGTAILADRFDHAFGLDLAFPSLVTASRILIDRTRPMRSYRLPVQGSRHATRGIRAKRRGNLEFVLAHAAHPPFRAAAVDAAISANLVDVVDNPAEVLKAKIRVLKEGGTFLLADPFEFTGSKAGRIGYSPARDPAEWLRARLRGRVRILEESDGVPWRIRHHDRGMTIYANLVIAGRRSRRRERE